MSIEITQPKEKKARRKNEESYRGLGDREEWASVLPGVLRREEREREQKGMVGCTGVRVQW